MLDWLIIGGGVQGTYLSHVLTSRLGYARNAVRVLDPHASPLSSWQRTTDACGMQFLRSPAAHHIGIRTNELLDFARERHADWHSCFLEPYLRPSLELWNTHAAHVIDRHELAQLRIRGLAQGISRQAEGYEVQTDKESFRSCRLVLAPGNSQPLHYPALAQDSILEGPRISHVFSPLFCRAAIAAGEHVAIIGSGVTAAQLAIRLASESGNPVTILTDRLPDISWFDTDPGWNGPRLLSILGETGNPARRLEMVTGARIRGSFPGDTAARLLECMVNHGVRLQIGKLDRITEHGQQVSVLFNQRELEFDKLVYATGFSSRPPAVTLLQRTAQELELPLAGAGWPVVNQFCQWAPGLYVAGALAQLELGPVSRNISGIRTFARRLAELEDAQA